MPDFKSRSNEQELMDDLDSSGKVIVQTLRELEIINKWLGGNNVTLSGLDQLIEPSVKNISIADLGCGGGDMLKLIAKWGRRKKLNLKLTGIDANASIIEFAKQNCAQYPEISFQTLNIFSDDFKSQNYDIITATLFTHHFEDDQLVVLLNQCRQQAKLGIVINDLHRHWFAYYSIKWLTQLFSKSEMVKNDAAVSVLRSFKKEELEQLIRKAGFKKYSLKWLWAFRWRLVLESV